MFQRELYHDVGGLSEKNEPEVEKAPQLSKTWQLALSASAFLASDFVISWWCHAASLSCAFPLDTLRIRSIAERTGAGVSWGCHRNLASIVRDDGARTLYTGMWVPVFTKGPLLGAAYCLNEAFSAALLLRRQAQHNGAATGRKTRRGMFQNQQVQLSLGEKFIAGALAGGAVAFFQCPIHTLQVTQQLSTSTTYIRASTRVGSTAVSPEEIYRYYLTSSNGFRRLFCGLGPEIALGSISRGLQFSLYEFLQTQTKALWPRSNKNISNKNQSNSQTPVQQKVLSAALAGAASWLCIYPIEVVRVHLQAERAAETFGRIVNGSKYKNSTTFSQAARQVYRRGGIRGFAIGWHLAVMRTTVTSAVALPLFDTIRTKVRGRFSFKKMKESQASS